MKTFLFFVTASFFAFLAHAQQLPYQTFKINTPPELVHCDCPRDTAPQTIYKFKALGSDTLVFIRGFLLRCKKSCTDRLYVQKKTGEWHLVLSANDIFIYTHIKYAYLRVDDKKYYRLMYDSLQLIPVSEAKFTHDCKDDIKYKRPEK